MGIVLRLCVLFFEGVELVDEFFVLLGEDLDLLLEGESLSVVLLVLLVLFGLFQGFVQLFLHALLLSI